MKQTEIHIGKLWQSPEGTLEKFHLELPIEFEQEDLNPTTSFISDVVLIKLKDEISVIIKNASITLKIKCEKCLEYYEQEINIKETEREYLYKAPKKNIDENEYFLINTEKMTIDLYDMIRQEIILHFPLISVCSNKCKGLCIKCGQNKNKKECNCEIEKDLEIQKPFKNLATLIKNSNK